ncbi:MAG: DUF1192 domain-containing protein [Hyphomicrobiaceae bacterium]|nr:DUF1192 domain-containing protein [Hyphomicrobiaceae bacterium]
MDWDEVRPKPQSSVITVGQDLSGQSIGELESRIETLKKEIERTEAELSRKRAHEAAASALFKS